MVVKLARVAGDGTPKTSLCYVVHSAHSAFLRRAGIILTFSSHSAVPNGSTLRRRHSCYTLLDKADEFRPGG